jgi:hypothetical protein
VQEVTLARSGWRFRVRNGPVIAESEDEPGLDWWTRLRLWLIYMLVPDEWL